MDSSEIKEIIKAEAEKLGFCFSGVTSPDMPDDFFRYRLWLENRSYGQMEYLNRKDAVEKRQHPRFLLNSVQSIVVLGTPIQASPLTGSFRIAAFAHYKDYHRQIYSLIEELIRRISEIAGEKPEYKICVDSSPVLERSLAVQAGLGWIGKSSMFISPEAGSLVLLSECLLSWKLPYDNPYPNDRCGKCTRCVDACPTKCIDPQLRTIQADHCISYLTVEHRGDIPAELAKKCGNQIFGCDICTTVCPWNQKTDTGYSPLERFHFSDNLSDDLNLTEEEFKKKYKDTAIYRVKNEGWKRNIKIALQNLYED